MGAKCTLNGNRIELSTEKDTIVIRQIVSTITGGRTLDLTDFDGKVINAGHIVVKSLDEDGVNYTYKPLGVTDGAYKALADGESVAGVVVATKPRDYAMVSILTAGRVNDTAMPYPLTDDLRSKFLTEMPTLIFEHD